MEAEPDDFDWSVASWEGSRRAQIRRWMSLTVRERLEMLEDMAHFARRMQRLRSARPADEAPAGKAK